MLLHLEISLKLGTVNQPKHQKVVFVGIMTCEKSGLTNYAKHNVHDLSSAFFVIEY